MGPVSIFSCRNKLMSKLSDDRDEGMEPENALPLRCKLVRDVSSPMLDGIVPYKLI